MSFGSKGSNTTTSSTAPNPVAAANYYNLMGQASSVASQPFQPYTGEFVAPVNAQQQAGIQGINTNAGYAQPYINSATSLALQAAQPIGAGQIGQYINPYQQYVVDSTQAQFNNQNAQQQSQLQGNAISQNALGGDRAAVAQAVLAGQQQRAQAPVIAGLYSQGYNTALNTALAEQQAQAQGAYSIGNLGISGQNAALTGANAQVGAGSLEQQTQQAQDAALYNQFLQQQAYPFQTTQWLAGLDTGVGSQLGGTSTTTGPKPNPLAQGLGLGLTGLGLAGKLGWAPFAASGGAINGLAGVPYADVVGYVPAAQIAPGQGMPKPASVSGSPVQDPSKTSDAIAGLVKGLGWGKGKGASSAVYDPAFNGYNVTGGTTGFGDWTPSPDLGGDVDYARGGRAGFDLGGAPLGDDSAPAEDMGPQLAFSGKDFSGLFSDATSKYGLPSGYLDRTAGIESSYNPNSRNASGASGLFQFMPGTAKQYGLSNPFDAGASTDAAARLAVSNAAYMRNALGRDPTAAELYLAHQQGPNGAIRLLQNPNAPAGSVVPAQNIAANGGNPNAPAGAFTNMWANRFDNSGGQTSPESGLGGGEGQGELTGGARQDTLSSPRGGDLSNALLAAGLGMLSSRSPFLGSAIGEGGLSGLAAYNAGERRTQDLDLAHQKLDMQAKQAQLAAARESRAASQAEERNQLAREHLDFQKKAYEQSKVPPNFRLTKEGNLEPIPGGPADLKQKQAEAGRISDEDARFVAEQLAAGDKSAILNWGRGANASENLNKVKHFQIEHWKQQNPNATGAEQAAATARFTADTAALRSQAVRQANVESNIEEAKSTFPMALDASEAVPRTDWVPVNKALLAVESGTGSPEVRRFVTANAAAVTAYSQAMARSGVATVDGRHAAEQLLKTADSKEAYAAAIDQMRQEMDAAAHAPKVVRDAILSNILQRARSEQSSAPATPAPAPSTPAPGAPAPSAVASPKVGDRKQFKQGWGVWDGTKYVPEKAP